MKKNKLIIGCANVGNLYGVNEKEKKLIPINLTKFLRLQTKK